MEQGATGGKHLILGTGTFSVLGFERENRAPALECSVH